MSNRVVSVILPAYNESKSITKVLENLIGYLDEELPRLGFSREVIAVDDGSLDNTYEMLGKIGNGVKIFRHENNVGKGAALKTGFSNSSGECVVFYDAGGDYHPKYILEFLREIREGADAVLGDKYSSGMRYPKYRIMVGKTFNSIVRSIFNLPFSDTQAGIKAFARKPLEENLALAVSDGYLFDAELVYHMHKNGCRIVRRPVQVEYNSGTGKNFFGKTADILRDLASLAGK